MSDDTTYGINYGPVPTLAPGSRTLLDTARGRLRDALEHAIASEVRPEDAALLLVNAYRGATNGPVERTLARIIARLLEDTATAEAATERLRTYGEAVLESRVGPPAEDNPHYRPLTVAVPQPRGINTAPCEAAGRHLYALPGEAGDYVVDHTADYCRPDLAAAARSRRPLGIRKAGA